MMKKLLFSIILSFVILVITSLSGYTQLTYVYSLSSNFQANPAEGPDLIPIPNNSGLFGEFVTREVPETTCGQTGNAAGYFFEDDAGLQFNNPEGFIGQSYSIAFNFQIDEFISPPSWVRILSFTHVDDVGIYILLTNPPDNGMLDFWPFGTVGETNFFSPIDFYQMILVRNDVGLIKIYVNGTEFAEYDDSSTQAYVPQEPDNFIIWFRDHPSVLADEASPGFVSDIILANYAWTSAEVNIKWEEFCSDLLSIDEQKVSYLRIYPNPTNSWVNIDLESKTNEKFTIKLFDIRGQLIEATDNITTGKTRIDTRNLPAGFYFVKLIADMRVYEVKKLIVE